MVKDVSGDLGESQFKGAPRQLELAVVQLDKSLITLSIMLDVLQLQILVLLFQTPPDLSNGQVLGNDLLGAGLCGRRGDTLNVAVCSHCTIEESSTHKHAIEYGGIGL
jgi:hypothetical protein